MKFVKPPDTGTDWTFGLGTGVAIALALAGTLLVVILARMLFRRRRACRWKRQPWGKAGIDRWGCAACGVDAFTSDGRCPKECKKDLKEAVL